MNDKATTPRATTPAELFARVPRSVILDDTLSLAGLRVYCYIAQRAAGRSHWYGPQREIADALGLDPRHVEVLRPQPADDRVRYIDVTIE